ncbi:helix-hairpin-helix domain-containing protein [Streptomyces sp. HB2AG]|nr:helix-hairpin-helix domain-containing protein [Streptomyces sp. HB2AG]MCZ2523170.1 helix-hairpin-helix domain-containing protein [Streptomyces sp. HB2AG]
MPLGAELFGPGSSAGPPSAEQPAAEPSSGPASSGPACSGVVPAEGAAAPKALPGRARVADRGGAVLRSLRLWLVPRCGMEPRSVAALAVVLAVAGGLALHHFWTGRPQPVRVPALTSGPAGTAPSPEHGPAPAPATARRTVVVDVAGKVRDPGVHRLPQGSRVTDALEAAGGALRGADTRPLNLARVLNDGEQILVGAPAAGAGGAALPGAVPGGHAAGGTAPAGPVSLNTATAEQLDALPGVGPVLARHIIDFRTRTGGFRSVAQLREVNGIGDRRFSDLKDLVTP